MFYGWLIVAVGFAIGLLTSGLHSYTRGIFLKPMAESLGASRLELSLGFTLTAAIIAVTGPFAGWLVDRLRLRRLMVGFVLWTAAGYGALALIESRWQLYFVLGVFFGLATFHLSGAAVPKLVVNWFERNRGLALSIVAMGASAAGAFAPLVATALIDMLGWRATLGVFAGLTLAIVLPMVVIWVRDRPQDLGLLPDGDAPSAKVSARAVADARRWRRAEYLRAPPFWGIVLIFGLMGCNFSAVSVHLYAHLTDIGIADVRAALVLSAMATLALVSKPLFGRLVDAFDVRVSVAISLAAQIAGIALLLVLDAFWPLLLAVAVFGTGYGGMVPLRNALTARAFGRFSFGEVGGAGRAAMAPLVMVGMPLAGWIFDNYHSYDVAFALLLALYGIACLGILLLRE
jgi:MFS family permease